MSRTIAFLRGMNVGGHRVSMEELRALFAGLGLAGVETFIASGNVIFDSPTEPADGLARRIEAGLLEALGYEVATFLRGDAELAAVAAYRPFAEEAMASAAALNVAFLAAPAGESAERALAPHRTESDDFHVHGREVYWMGRTLMSQSPFFKVGFERVLKVPVTVRGLNTVRKLAAKYPPQG